MASRVSRGCLPCRTRRVKCDEGRPSCRKCVRRNEVCTGYRDDASLIFRDMTQKVARTSVRRRNSTSTMSRSSSSTHSTGVSPMTNGTSASDESDLSPIEISSLKLSIPFPWAKSVPESSVPSPEDQAVSQFFEKFVMYPCNSGSSPGFLEHLPSLFKEVKTEGRMALRWAVRAASYASLSSEQKNAALRAKALSCYGQALSALGESLADPNAAPDDFTLMTVVVLDLFENVYLQEQGSRGSHAEGMAQILRLRGPDQIYGSRGWSLFRLSHHRLQRQQLGFRQAPLPESEAWLDSLNDDLPYIRIEKDNLQISKICERARNLLASLDSGDLSIDQTLEMVKEIHDLDQVAVSWRRGPGWTYKTIHHSEISHGEEASLQLPEYIQLHHDVWIAYEWNYHRTARIIMHEHLLECLYKLHNLHWGDQDSLPASMSAVRETSVTIIRSLIDEILSTVPQSLGDIDHEGNILHDSLGTRTCRGVGGYFLLWPIRVVKATASATTQQRAVSEGVFERIREYTGMKTVLGESSKI